MTTKRNHLPQLDGGLFVTDGGLETTLIFHDGIDLPYFASYGLLRDRQGTETIRQYFVRYATIARDNNVGLILDSPTWRASADWGDKMGYSEEALAVVNKESIEMLAEIRDEYETATSPMVLGGCIGPRGDGYDPGNIMTAEEAEAYHAKQIGAFRDSKADMINALTMTNLNEALGVTRAAKAAGMPVAIGFTVETDGKLPSGQDLGEAVEAVDAATGSYPAYYMINCAHPDHFLHVLESGEPWLQRLRGLRANASRMSHAELDNAEKLDDGNPAELGKQFGDIRDRNPQINVVGGCCGTDHRHIEHICNGSKQFA
jgi:S-methylmethionine-dependent homocysteine/selenocysteine methylase